MSGVGERDHFNINYEDEVARGALVLHNGELKWPAPPPKELSAPPPPKPAAVVKKVVALTPADYFRATAKNAASYSAGLGAVLGLGVISPNAAFAAMTTTYVSPASRVSYSLLYIPISRHPHVRVRSKSLQS